MQHRALAAMRTIHGTVDTSTPSVSDEGVANNATGDANNATAAANNATGAANNTTGGQDESTAMTEVIPVVQPWGTDALRVTDSNEKKDSKKDDASQKNEKVRCEKPPKKRQKSSHSSEN